MRKGFTLIEIVIVLAILVVIVAIAIFALNPAEQLAKARNNERRAHLNSIVNAIGRNIADNNGAFNCATGPIPTATSTMADNNPPVGDYNIASCLIPIYLFTLPFDPASTTAKFLDVTDYYTGYTIFRDALTGRITLSSPGAELGETINVTR